MFRDAVAAFAEEEVRPRVAEMENAGKIDPTLLPKYFDLGLMGIEVPEQYGGAGGTLFMVTLAVEEISKIDAAAAIVCDVQNTLVNYPIVAYGTETQKAKYLPMLTSEVVGAYALSESGSGSDAFGLATKAEKRGARSMPPSNISTSASNSESHSLISRRSSSRWRRRRRISKRRG